MGYKGTKEYTAWLNAKSRCFNKKNISYKNYGARGITMCKRWKESFKNFLHDMGKPQSFNHTLDRIDVNGDYEPANCRWATRDVQSNNKRNNVYLEYNGMKKSITEWEKYLGLKEGVIKARVQRLGWTAEKAITTPVKETKKRIYKGEIKTIAELSRMYGVKETTITERIKSGWSIEDAVKKPADTRFASRCKNKTK